MPEAERGIEYSDAERSKFANLVAQALHKRGWNQKTLANTAGVQESAVGFFIRQLSERVSHTTFLQICLALDINIYTAIRVLRLDRYIKKSMALGVQYPTYQSELKHLNDLVSNGDEGTIASLLKDVPADRQALCLEAINGVVEAFKQKE